MKLIKTLAFLIMSGLLFLSCGKELSEENGGGSGNAVGTLKADLTSGECLPATPNGIFMAGTPLTSSNSLTVTVDITAVGAYAISTNIVNGYSFTAVGVATTTGIQTIRLNGTGTPTASGANTFTVTFGTSECDWVINVLPAGTGAAAFTLAGAGAACTGAVVAGTYTAGTAVTASNTATIGVDVTTIGTYNISVPASNGVSFSGSGAFTTTGAQTVVLTASGTPATAGTNNSTITAGGGSCTFSVTTVGSGGGAAVFTLAGAGGACTGATVAGTYTTGVAVTAANTVTISVNVQTVGTYNINVPAVNGISFSKSGTFTATGVQTVVLTASGTPTAAGTNNSTVTVAAGSCTFSVTTVAAGGAAVFTLNGAGGTCTGATVAGTYTAGTALTAANTVTLNVNVTTAGTYSITVPVANGITFSGTGTFTGTAAQTVVLTATGTPTTAGTNNFTVTVGAGNCTFSVTTVAGTPTNFFQCRIDGGAMQSFNNGLIAELDNTSDPTLISLDIYGEGSGTGLPAFEIYMDREMPATIPAGTYTVNQLANNVYLFAGYLDPAMNIYYVETDLGGGTVTPGFTVTIQSITATRVTGIFSGTILVDGIGPQTKTITEGSFSVGF